MNNFNKHQKRNLFFMLLFVLSMAIPVFAQGPTVNVESLQINDNSYPNMEAVVSVVSEGGVPIVDLMTSDFEVLEDNQPLEITNIVAESSSTKPIAIALVLDLSGSAPLEDIQSAANQFLDSLGPDDQVALIGFNTPIDDLDGVDPFSESNFTTDKETVRTIINNWTSADIIPQSAVYEAIYKGVLFTAKQIPNHRAVIVMTDGFDNASRPEIATVDSSRASARDKKIPIFTVGVLNPDPKLGRNPVYLQSLASETGADYQEVSDLAELGTLFQSIGERLRQQYRIDFKTALKRDGSDHVLTIRVTTSEGQGSVDQTRTYPSVPAIPEIEGIKHAVNGELKDFSSDTELRGTSLIVPEISAKNNIDKVDYFVNGDLEKEILVAKVVNYEYSPWEWQWNTAGLPIGNYQLSVVVYDEAAAVSPPFNQDVQVAECNFVCQFEERTGLTLDPITVGIIAFIVLLLLGLVLYLISKRSKRDVETDYVFPPEPPTQSGFAPPPAVPASSVASAEGGPPPLPNMNPTVNAEFSNVGGANVHQPEKTMVLRKKLEAIGMLVMVGGQHAGRQFALEHGATIGRANTNLIVIDDSAASGQHAKIKLDDKVFTIYDMGSTNGTRVNGQDITRQQLVDGDKIEIGETKFVFKQVATD